MKKTAMTTLLMLLASAQSLYACSCPGWRFFLESAESAPLVVSFTVTGYQYGKTNEPNPSPWLTVIETRVDEVLRGAYDSPELRLKATSGSDCGYSGSFPIGSRWVAAVNKWLDKETGQEVFAILGCGSSALELTDGEVKGHIFRPADLSEFDLPRPGDASTITLEELRAHLE